MAVPLKLQKVKSHAVHLLTSDSEALSFVYHVHPKKVFLCFQGERLHRFR